MGHLVAGLGRNTISLLDRYLEFSRLLVDSLYWTVVAPVTGRGIRVRSTITHMVLHGFNAVPIVCFIAGLMGFIMGLQGAYQMQQFGVVTFVPDLVAVSMTRELGPLMTAIILSGRSGSAFAAEIGTMVVAEEIDALKTMGLNPLKFLVVPKIVAMLIMQPILSLIADVAGIMGGWLVGSVQLGLSSRLYFDRTIEVLLWRDIWTGQIKAAIFALIITTVGCYFGFHVRGGAQGVGRATTATVVTSIFLVILADGVFTFIFFLTG